MQLFGVIFPFTSIYSFVDNNILVFAYKVNTPLAIIYSLQSTKLVHFKCFFNNFLKKGAI